MAKLLCNSCLLKCSFGSVPAPLTVLPQNRVLTHGQPAATILDNKPLINIPSFGLCRSLTNPTVASATAAAMGVLTPMPCMPATVAPWTPGSPKIVISNAPIITEQSKLLCSWGGVIAVESPAQVTVIAN